MALDSQEHYRQQKNLFMYVFLLLSFVLIGYDGAPSFPGDFAKYVHDLLDKSHKERPSTNPILIS